MGQRIIGLTGGIATGKTTVSRYLADHYGLPILDADVYAREAVAVGSPILAAIAQRYGADLLHPDGSLNRPALGHIIFNHADEKQWVEAQIHPFVRQCSAAAMATQPPEATVVQAIPLLFEAGLTDQVTEIWVVTCDEATQLRRLQARDGWDEAAAIARIRSQWPLADKVAQADVVLTNDGAIAHLRHQIDQALG
ncbi:MAG: dephospho-CoA kinase [Cyanobacteria bacterium]|nr:dephospho-CoA kinase [Cyanobacteriota bacterium]